MNDDPNPDPSLEPPPLILVCDDEPAARRAVVRALGSASYRFLESGDGRELLGQLERAPKADLVLLDLRMPGMDGMTTLGHLMALETPLPVVVLTADHSLRAAIDAVRAGAADYLQKPYEIDELRLVVERALATDHLRREHRRLAEEVRVLRGERALLGGSPLMTAVFDAIERVAPSRASVLILGESGTGKELVARRIHERSGRARRPFVTLNCAAIPETLVESELFGHRRGAFTGADRDRPGKFREADGGTLFLDEVGDLAPAAQAKLLRVLQEGVVEPLGGGRPVPVDVRVLAATHRDLKTMATEGRFRDDLLFRLRVVDLELPPLRARGEDVLVLARHFLAHGLRLAPETERVLTAYGWPGNVRELANAIERAGIFCRGGVVRPEDLPADVRGSSPGTTSGEALLAWREGEDFATAKTRMIDRFERAMLGAAMAEHAGNVSRAARRLGMHRQTLQQKLRELGMRGDGTQEEG